MYMCVGERERERDFTFLGEGGRVGDSYNWGERCQPPYIKSTLRGTALVGESSNPLWMLQVGCVSGVFWVLWVGNFGLFWGDFGVFLGMGSSALQYSV